MGIGWALFNETVVVICDPAFYVDRSEENLALGLGLGLGIGIPFLLFVLFRMLRAAGLLHNCNCRRKPKLITDSGPVFVPKDKRAIVRDALTEEAFTDFMTGSLSERLKEELMVYRVRAGRNLTEFVEYATELEHLKIADYCNNLFPTSFPPSVFVKARGVSIPIGEEKMISPV